MDDFSDFSFGLIPALGDDRSAEELAERKASAERKAASAAATHNLARARGRTMEEANALAARSAGRTR